MSGIERILYSEHVYWGRLFDDFPDYQFVLYDAAQKEVVAEGHTAPCRWDETADGLGDGVDAMIAAAFEARDRGHEPNALCALAAEIRPAFQGRGLANRILDEMAGLARGHGMTPGRAPGNTDNS